jgi:integrase/recombinase XerD
MAGRPKAPRGCYWRGTTLYGRVTLGSEDIRWSLETDDPAVARQRRQAGKAKLVAAARFGDARTTFDDALVAWSKWILRQVGPNTATRYACSIDQLEPLVSGKHLDEIDGRLVAEIIRRRQSGGVTNATIKRDLGALSSVMNFSIDQGWCEHNPVLPRLRRLRERREPIALPRPEDVAKVIARIPGSFGEMVGAALATGARQEELANALRSHLDLRARRLTLIGKGNKARVIDLTPFGGVEIFARLPAAIGNAPLFWHGNGERYENVASRFAGYTREIAANDKEFRRFRYHDLRHLHAVEWLRSGRSLYDLQKRLGHTSIKTTEVYLAFLTPDEERAAKDGTGTNPGTAGYAAGEEPKTKE